MKDPRNKLLSGIIDNHKSYNLQWSKIMELIKWRVINSIANLSGALTYLIKNGILMESQVGELTFVEKLYKYYLGPIGNPKEDAGCYLPVNDRVLHDLQVLIGIHAYYFFKLYQDDEDGYFGPLGVAPWVSTEIIHRFLSDKGLALLNIKEFQERYKSERLIKKK